ncbi:hypothetical protein M011DRAFT_477158 [Sporormia fimetaria CBS 119925]|uniref:Autophagy-related protein 29 n=1 Tax=Sporormia fimetaria CBS 119925 TaxID=1340428 RepID=A0A6A6VA89_9PLEO|nr:hypothetical protein M011DRAFT_477158 [Sporormia fimetaria CBS 119925]
MSAIHFTTLIRLPFVRGEFDDPPQAEWNATKDRALWKVISKSAKTSELNWAELSDRFQVSQTFLLQQAAWLYERHFEHVRSQMKKVGSTNAPATAGSGSSNTVIGGVPMQRGGSYGSRSSRTPSSLSVRPREGQAPKADAFTPAPPTLSRTPSTNTITQSRANTQANQGRSLPQRSGRPSFTGTRPTIPNLPSPVKQESVVDEDSPENDAFSSSSDSSDSELDAPIHRSQLFKRPPRFQKQKPTGLTSYDEDPDEDPTGEALPFAQPQRTLSGGRGEAGGQPQQKPSHRKVPSQSEKASSASDVSKPSKVAPGPLSPKHREQLARLSPRHKKDGSEGTPSMGSSFSDIDGLDASVSQSALEDALLSNIHAGRMSTLSALRSRYL